MIYSLAVLPAISLPNIVHMYVLLHTAAGSTDRPLNIPTLHLSYDDITLHLQIESQLVVD